MQNIHPLFVHFPIALLSMAFLFDLLGSFLKRDSLRNAGWWCLLLGILAVIGAATTGLLAEGSVTHTDESHEVMETHETLELIAGGTFVLLFLWRGFRRTVLPQMPLLILYLALGLGAVGVMFYGAHLGGRLVYEFGVGTQFGEQLAEEHEHSVETQSATEGSNQPASSEEGKAEEHDDEHAH